MGPLMRLVGKKVMSAVVNDARWLEGEKLMDQTPNDFGASIRIYFDDFTYIDIEPIPDPHIADSLLVGSREGTWRDNNGAIEVLT